MQFNLRYIIPVTLFIFVMVWVISFREKPEIQPIDYLDEIQGINDTTECQIQVLGIQPFMETNDYASREHLEAKLNTYLQELETKGYLNHETIVLFPEHIASWLVAANEKNLVYSTGKISKAMMYIILNRPLAFLKSWLKSNEQDKTAAAIFRMKSQKMAGEYTSIFSSLANQYNINIVAGSIILQNPYIKDNKIFTSKGPLYNVSAVFFPDGTVYPRLIFKVYPTSEELMFLSGSEQATLPVIPTSAGQLKVMICADSWYPDLYENADLSNVEIIVVPSFATGENIMKDTWQGYDGHENPADVMLEDLGRITEGEAWDKYSLEGRISLSGARTGMNMYLRGQIWDLVGDGDSKVIYNDSILKVNSGSRAGILYICK